MNNDLSRLWRGPRSFIERGLEAVARLVAASGGDPTSARSVLPGMAFLSASFLFTFVGVPMLIASQFGWEPKPWQLTWIAALGLVYFSGPLLVGVLLLAWPPRRMRRPGDDRGRGR